MHIQRHKQFEKSLANLSAKQRQKVLAALLLYLADSSNKSLRLHQLQGNYYPQWSMSVGGDLRIHFVKMNNDEIILMLVGTHAQLYG